MKMKTIVTCALATLCLMAFAQQGERHRRPDGGERPRRHAMGGDEMHRRGTGPQGGEYGGERSRRFSGDGERRRPQFSEETRKLIAAYHRDPTEANKAALRKQVEADYEKRIERKKEQLAELKRAAGSESRVREMEGELDEMIQNRDRRIDHMMTRFTEKRSRPAESEAREGHRQHRRLGEGHRGGGRSSRPTRQAR